MYSTSISLLILSYNDGESLSKLVQDAYAVLQENFAKYQVVITDDGSQQETHSVLDELEQKYPNLGVVRSKSNEGVGANFAKGILACECETIAYIDGDGQYAPQDLIKLFPHLTTTNMVSGLRVKRNDSVLRILTSSVYNLLLRLLYKLKFKDVNSGLKLFNRDILMSFPVESVGPFYDAEVILKHALHNYEIIEIPINHYRRKHGHGRGISKKNLRLTIQEIFSAKNYSLIANSRLSRNLYFILKAGLKASVRK